MEEIQLEINLPNPCNISCRYCCSNGLDYTTNWDIKKVFSDIKILLERSVADRLIILSNNTEPFNNMDFLEAITEFTNFYCILNDKTFIYKLTTNGTLLHLPRQRAYFDKWYNHIYLNYSLNGLKEVQDYSRSNTFDICMSNFMTIKPTHLSSVSVTLLPEKLGDIF